MLLNTRFLNNFVLRRLGFLLFFIVFIFPVFASSNTLFVTPEHPFYIKDSWVDARDLQVGDLIKTYDGKTARITAIRLVEPSEPFFVYNLEVPFFSNFLVGKSGLIVHNSNVPGKYQEYADLTNDLKNRIRNNDFTASELERIKRAKSLLPEDQARLLDDPEMQQALLLGHYSGNTIGGKNPFVFREMLDLGLSKQSIDTLADESNMILGFRTPRSLTPDEHSQFSHEIQDLIARGDQPGVRVNTAGSSKQVVTLKVDSLDESSLIAQIAREQGLDEVVIKRVPRSHTGEYFAEIRMTTDVNEELVSSGSSSFFGKGNLIDAYDSRSKELLLMDQHVGESFEYVTNALSGLDTERMTPMYRKIRSEVFNRQKEVSEILQSRGYQFADSHTGNFGLEFTHNGKTITFDQIVKDTSMSIDEVTVTLRAYEAGDLRKGFSPTGWLKWELLTDKLDLVQEKNGIF